MDFNDFRFLRLRADYEIKPFDCSDHDLNDFLICDSRPHLNQLFSVTYLLENDEHTVAFFTLVNDKIKVEDSKSKSFWKSKVGSKIPHNKRRNDYPAVKIARLGVHNDF